MQSSSDSPPLTPTGSTSSSSHSNSDSTTASSTVSPGVNPLYSQLHPAGPTGGKSQLVVKDFPTGLSSIKQQSSVLEMVTPLSAPQGGGSLLEEVRSGSTMTISPSSHSNSKKENAQQRTLPSSNDNGNYDQQEEEDDGASKTRVTHDERDHIVSKLHEFKRDAKEFFARDNLNLNLGLNHHRDSTRYRSSLGESQEDRRVKERLDRPLGIDSGEEEEDGMSGDETETETETENESSLRRGNGVTRLERIETKDSRTTEYMSADGDGGASFYSAESDLDGTGANSTVDSLPRHFNDEDEQRRSESPVSFTVDGTSPPRLEQQQQPNGTNGNGNGIDRYPIAYAPGYVPTNSRLIPIPSSPSNRPSSPSLRSTSPKLNGSPRLPLPYVSSHSSTSTSTAASSSSNRLVPTASIVKPSTSHPSLSHLSSSHAHQPQPQPQPQNSSNYIPPTRRASTTSPSLHPPSASFAQSNGGPSRRGSSASTLLRPTNSSQYPSSPPQPPVSSSAPQRSLSTSQLTPSNSATTISQSLLLPLPSHSSTFPPPPPLSVSTTPTQSPSLSRGLSQMGQGGGQPSIHDDVESSIALQAEQIRRQRAEKRMAVEAAERRLLNEATSRDQEKGKGREEEGMGMGARGVMAGLRRNSTQTQQGGGGGQQRQMSMTSQSGGRTRSGSGLGGLGRESFDQNGLGLGGGGGSALSTTSLALPLAPPMTTTTPGASLMGPSSSSLAPPPVVGVGLGKAPSVRSSSLGGGGGGGGSTPHVRSGSGGSTLLLREQRERERERENSSKGGRRSVSGESTISQSRDQAPLNSSTTSTVAPPPSSSQSTTQTQARPPSSSGGGLQRTHSQAPTISLNPSQLNAQEKLVDGEKEEGQGQGGTGAAGVPLVGNLIGTDHENYVLMYNMLTGIRIGVSRCQAKAARPLTDADYTARHKFSFDIVGNELTPSVRYDFKFKDYAPWVFRELREYFFLDPSDYLISLTAKYILSELGSPGKSGSFFYFSRDYRFIIKTIRHSEHKFLRKILKEYHEHVKKNPHTLLSRFYGLHRVKLPHGRKIHFVIMNNLFPPHRDIHETYDLKGSSVGRFYPESKAAQNPHAVLKDLNWLLRRRQLELGPEKKVLFEEQLRRDTELMQKLGIMDYSLLTGVHLTNKGNEERLREGKLSVFQPDAPKPTRKPTQIHRSADASALRAAAQRSDPQSITSGQDLPEHDTSTERRRFLFYQDEGGMRATGEGNEELGVIYYLGIIDILTPYTCVKRLEHFFKGIKNDKYCISAVPPKEYGDRFLNFIRSCVRGNPESLRPKMWMPPISEEEEFERTENEIKAGTRGGGGGGGGEEKEGEMREKREQERGKEKVQ